MINKPQKTKTTGLVLTTAILLGIIFWVVDSVLNFYFFSEHLRFMVFQRPETLLESAVTNISFYTLFVRISFLVACAIGGVLTAIFIYRRKKAEEALQKSEEKFRKIFESSNDAMMLLDENEFLDCNNATLKIGRAHV